MTLEELNALDPEDAARELSSCCGSTRWARAMAAARPFAGLDAMLERLDAIWSALDGADWLEAFAAHQRIGERKKAGEAGGEAGQAGQAGRAGAAAQAGTTTAHADATHARWSADEQSGVTDDARDRLLALNRDYEARFGYIFIICATGKSGREMLEALERRLRNNPGEELREAAEEQRQIARLRLTKLMR